MTHIIIALDGSTYIHKDSQKSPDELCREVKLGSFEYPIPMKDPTAVRLQNYLLIAERDQNPLLNTNQLILLDLLCQGATDKQMQQAMATSTQSSCAAV